MIRAHSQNIRRPDPKPLSNSVLADKLAAAFARKGASCTCTREGQPINEGGHHG